MAFTPVDLFFSLTTGGLPLAGAQVTAVLNQPLNDVLGNVTAVPREVNGTTDASGQCLLLNLEATDDINTMPVGGTYHVTARHPDLHPYYIERDVSLPASSAGGVANFADLAPATTFPTYSYATRAEVQGIGASDRAEITTIQGPYTTSPADVVGLQIDVKQVNYDQKIYVYIANLYNDTAGSSNGAQALLYSSADGYTNAKASVRRLQQGAAPAPGGAANSSNAILVANCPAGSAAATWKVRALRASSPGAGNAYVYADTNLRSFIEVNPA